MPDGGALTGSLAAPIIGGLLGGSDGGSSPSGNQTITNKAEIDPQMRAILYGSGRKLKGGVNPTYGPSTEPTQRWVQDPTQYFGGRMETIPGTQGAQNNPESDYTTDNGLLGRITGLFDQSQKPGMSTFGTGIDDYLSRYGRPQFDNNMRSAVALQDSNISAPGMQAAQIKAPSQNGIDLAPAYQSMINGDPAKNPYLTGAIQKGIDQSNNAFGNMQTDATRNLTENILPSIRSGARVSGNYGGNREALTEGKALNDYSTQMQRAISQFGQNNTDAAVGARAGAFDNGQNRALSAMTGLGSQQYGVAGQNAGFQQQANQSNQQAQLTTNNLNSANQQAGLSASSGLLGQAYGYGTNNDSYAGNQVGRVSGLLAPYTGLGGSSSQTSPLYQNTGAGILGGAMMGSQVGKNLNFGGSNSITSPYDSIFKNGGF